MSENKHPVSLMRLFFTRSIVVSIPEHKPVDRANVKPGEEEIIAGPVNNIDVAKVNELPGVYQASMHTLLNQNGDPINPYIVDMQCVGMFKVDESIDNDEALRAVTITAHTVLYGAIRESVSWITGRHPFGPLLLGLSVLRPSSPKDSSSKN